MSNVLSFYYKFLDFAARLPSIMISRSRFLKSIPHFKVSFNFRVSALTYFNFISFQPLHQALNSSLRFDAVSFNSKSRTDYVKKKKTKKTLHFARLSKRCTFLTLSSNHSVVATPFKSTFLGRNLRTPQLRVILCLCGCRDDMGDIRVFMNSLPGGLNFRHEVCMHYIVSHLSV